MPLLTPCVDAKASEAKVTLIMKRERSRWYMVIWEIVLILGSIPLFRSVWILCDRSDFLNQYSGLLLSLAVGLVICVVALLAINHKGKGQDPDETTP